MRFWSVMMFLASTSGALSLAACSSATTTTTDGGGGGGTADMATKPPSVTISGADGGVPADVKCIPNSTDPAAPTMDTVVNGVIKDFQDSNLVVGATVAIYATPEDVVANKPMATSMPSDKDGKYTITVPAGHYRIIRGNQGGKAVSNGVMTPTIPTVEFNMKFDDPAPTSVKVTTKEVIAGLVSVSQMDGLGVLAGKARDCSNTPMGGAIISVVLDGNASYSSAGSTFYFRDVEGAGTLPVRNQKWTTETGDFAVLNIPGGIATATAWGVPAAGGDVVKLSQYKIPVIADWVTVIDMPSGPTVAK